MNGVVVHTFSRMYALCDIVHSFNTISPIRKIEQFKSARGPKASALIEGTVSGSFMCKMLVSMCAAKGNASLVAVFLLVRIRNASD